CGRMSAEHPCSKSRGLKESLQLSDTGWMPHLAQRLCFDLANALAGNLELPAYFFQSSAVSVDQPESLFEYLTLPISERLQHVLDFFLWQAIGLMSARFLAPSIPVKLPEFVSFR